MVWEREDPWDHQDHLETRLHCGAHWGHPEHLVCPERDLGLEVTELLPRFSLLTSLSSREQLTKFQLERWPSY
ncbi:hypothetical protein DPMN_131297 [Dreissena polymorpha]|uniref:Uncharacterized protein n=1 Tax=Dreissena polymorpha TaxID=45954 RepID=A0A9D4H999_DREPO|nr:hypothetical protein DPMN_131297 [Dreissena polymorpha]